MKKGDTYKVGYICDCHKHNYNTGIVIWVNPFKYYPDGNIEEYIIKTQFEVEFSNGDKMMFFK